MTIQKKGLVNHPKCKPKMYYSNYTKGQADAAKHTRTEPAIYISGVEQRSAYRKLLPSFPWKLTLPPYIEILKK